MKIVLFACLIGGPASCFLTCLAVFLRLGLNMLFEQQARSATVGGCLISAASTLFLPLLSIIFSPIVLFEFYKAFLTLGILLAVARLLIGNYRSVLACVGAAYFPCVGILIDKYGMDWIATIPDTSVRVPGPSAVSAAVIIGVPLGLTVGWLSSDLSMAESQAKRLWRRMIKKRH